MLAEHQLGHSEQTLLVGVSGGPDSVCLFHILSSLQTALGFRLSAAHMDHMLRGKSSKDDVAYVAGLCDRHKVALYHEAVDVASYKRSNRLSLEEAARECRYAFFGRAAEEAGTRVVVLGHTSDDQVETVLMHVLRGAGLAGLRGMAPVSHRGALLVARPLLGTLRVETEAYCAEAGLMPRQDASNMDRRFLRNRLRLDTLPALRDVNPRVDAALLRLAENAGSAGEAIEAMVSEKWPLLVRGASEGVALDRRGLAQLHDALAAEALRRAVLEVAGSLKGISSEHIARLLALANGPTGRRTRLPHGIEAMVDYEVLHIARSRDLESPPVGFGGSYPVRFPGQARVPDWEVRSEVVPRAQGSKPGGLIAEMHPGLRGTEAWVRSRRDGDRFKPAGMRGSKKLQDFLVDSRVPRAKRDSVPLLCDPEGILWVVGYRLDQRALPPVEADRVLRVEFRPAN